MALGTTNISTTLVSSTIGLDSHDVGTLCTSNKINKWSRCNSSGTTGYRFKFCAPNVWK